MQILIIPELYGISIEVYFILLILGLPVYFICRKVFRKFIKKDSTRRIAVWISTIILTPVLYGGLILLFFFIISYHPNYNFDKKAWLDNKEERYKLSEDIINSKLLVGKTKSEVRNLLGDDGNLDTTDNWHYYLGFKPQFASIDPDVLEIEFKNDRVVDVTQRQH